MPFPASDVGHTLWLTMNSTKYPIAATYLSFDLHHGDPMTPFTVAFSRSYSLTHRIWLHPQFLPRDVSWTSPLSLPAAQTTPDLRSLFTGVFIPSPVSNTSIISRKCRLGPPTHPMASANNIYDLPRSMRMTDTVQL